VDGQHSHALRRDLHVAFDFDVGRLDLAQKIMQRRRLVLLVGQRQGQEFVDWVGGFGPEPANQRSPAAVLPEQHCINQTGVEPALARHSASWRAASCAGPSRAHKGFGGRCVAPQFSSALRRKTDERGLDAEASVRSSSGSSAAAAATRSIMMWSLSFEPVRACGLHVRRAGARSSPRKSVSAANGHDIFPDAPDFAGRGSTTAHRVGSATP
jgi:hypothetical protein